VRAKAKYALALLLMKVSQPYWVYVLRTDVGQCFYIGVTEEVSHRLAQHNGGESRWTRRYAGTWRRVWQKQFASLSEARKFENLLKRQKRATRFFTLTGLDPEAYRGISSGS